MSDPRYVTLLPESHFYRETDTLVLQLLISGSVKSLDTIFAEFDKVTVESVTKVRPHSLPGHLIWQLLTVAHYCRSTPQAAAAALASKASTVAIGDVHKLPYIDSLGL